MQEFDDILISGLPFRRGTTEKHKEPDKLKTKARKKQYITGAHGSGSSKQKAKYRANRANRKK